MRPARVIDIFFYGSLGLAAGTLTALIGCTNDRIRGVVATQAAPADASAADVDLIDAAAHLGVDAAAPMDAGGWPDATTMLPVDAGAPPPPPRCGDGTCNGGEACDSCERDCGRCGWPMDWAVEEDAMVHLINTQRAAGATCGRTEFGPAPPVGMDNELREAARGHSQDMADNNYFDHQSQDGRSPWDRIGATSYAGRGVGENIAAGNGTAEATFRQWLTSPGHCANFMNPSARDMGVGYARGPGRFRHYWTQVFGR